MSYHFVGIDHVQLAAPRGCEEPARHFYEGILGMTGIPKPEKLQARGGVWFQCGRHQVHIGVQEDYNQIGAYFPQFSGLLFLFIESSTYLNMTRSFIAMMSELVSISQHASATTFHWTSATPPAASADTAAAGSGHR
jgi:hypothetical protein